MFQITKLSQTSVNFLSQLNLSGKSRSIKTSIALGKVLADSISVPTSPTEIIYRLFNIQYRLAIEEIISGINEICVLDIQQVLDYTVKFYTYRYNICNPSGTILAFNKETALADFFRINLVLDKESVNVITEDPIGMTDLVNNLTKIINETNKENQQGV